MKLAKPSHITIRHRPYFFFFWNPSEFFWDMIDFVTSLHATFGRKLAKLRGSVEDAVLMKMQMENIKRRKMRPSTRWLSRFFKILGFWLLKFQKNLFFWKMNPEIQNFQNFKKTVTYVIQLLVVYQCTKFHVNSSIFDPQMECFCLRNHTHLWRHVFKCDFCNFWGSYEKQKQMTSLDSWAKTGQGRHLFCPHL